MDGPVARRSSAPCGGAIPCRLEADLQTLHCRLDMQRGDEKRAAEAKRDLGLACGKFDLWSRSQRDLRAREYLPQQKA